MRSKLLAKPFVVVLLLLCQQAVAQPLWQYVQPMAGTAPANTPAAIKHSEAGGTEKNANTIPAVGWPFGMTQWVPETRTTETKCIPPYLYTDQQLTGFRATHWISGSCMQDYGSFTIVPVVGKLRTTAAAYATPFEHASEQSDPTQYNIRTQSYAAALTGTLRAGIMEFTMLQDDSLYLLLIPNTDYAKGFASVDATTGTMQGRNDVHRIYQGWGKPAGFSGWMYALPDIAPGVAGSFVQEKIFFNASVHDVKGMGVFVGYHLRKGERVTLRMGTSFTSIENARQNLQAEIGIASWASIQQQAAAEWQQALGTIRVTTSNEQWKRIFYTSLYHSFQQPRLMNDVNGAYPKFSGNGEVMQLQQGNYYDDFSMWDIYRAQLPLLSIVDTSLTNSFVRSMILKAEQGKWLPIFPCWNSYTSAMIGDHVTAFIASAYNRGLRNYDVLKAYGYMRRNAFEVADSLSYVNGVGRRAMDSWLRYGYIPLEDSVPIAFHKKEQVSRTLEYAFDDYALATMAKQLGFQKDAAQLQKSAGNYRNVFDKQVGMMNGRYANGSWYQPFQPDVRQPFITEGTARQYSFYVPHAVQDLATLMGGSAALERALDSLFTKAEYWHGNEPGHQIPFMYNFTASPWKTQLHVRDILITEYSDGAGGLSGNDDAGQMSAWYVFAAMGFYPLNPVNAEYMLCAPLFDSIDIQLPAGKSFSIRCSKKSAEDQYIQNVRWNGKLYSKNYITHAMIANGGVLEIQLGSKPTTWGSKPENRSAEKW